MSPGVVETSELLESPPASASSESANPIRQGAKIVEGLVHTAEEAKEKKEEVLNEVEKSLQPPQYNALPPEKP